MDGKIFDIAWPPQKNKDIDAAPKNFLSEFYDNVLSISEALKIEGSRGSCLPSMPFPRAYMAQDHID